MDFHGFRQIYYHLQYQFYLRSERANRKGTLGSLPRGAIGLFLFRLTEYPEEEHCRWEVFDDRPRFVGRKQGSAGPTIRQGKAVRKQPANPPDHFPHPSEANRKSVIYGARKDSLRCRYMLFEYPKGFRKDQISSLCKSLIVYDLVNLHECKPWEIAQAIVDKKTDELLELRAKTYWEILAGRAFESIPILQAIPVTADGAFNETSESIAQRFLSTLVTNITDGTNRRRKDTVGEDKHDHTRKIFQEVQRYLHRAESLAKLAAVGQLREFPSLLKNR